MTIFNDDNVSNNYTINAMMEQIMGYFMSIKKYDIQKDLFFILGLGFGGNIALMSAASQLDTSYIHGIIIENCYYKPNCPEIQKD